MTGPILSRDSRFIQYSSQGHLKDSANQQIAGQKGAGVIISRLRQYLVVRTSKWWSMQHCDIDFPIFAVAGTREWFRLEMERRIYSIHQLRWTSIGVEYPPVTSRLSRVNFLGGSSGSFRFLPSINLRQPTLCAIRGECECRLIWLTIRQDISPSTCFTEPS